jgi:NADP-dependent 3-hydroxy acid dehydrogenase YdfG
MELAIVTGAWSGIGTAARLLAHRGYRVVRIERGVVRIERGEVGLYELAAELRASRWSSRSTPPTRRRCRRRPRA